MQLLTMDQVSMDAVGLRRLVVSYWRDSVVVVTAESKSNLQKL